MVIEVRNIITSTFQNSIIFFFFIIYFLPDLLLCNVKYTIFHIIVFKIVAKALVLAVDCALLWPVTPYFILFFWCTWIKVQVHKIWKKSMEA